MSNKTLPEYILALLRPDAYSHTVETIKLVETHISWVILTGSYAYKIKKPVNLGFLDFSSLEKRYFYCQEELRLNSRLAPALYLEVVAITGPEQQAVFSDSGPVIEYAVKMLQFPTNMQMDKLLNTGQIQLRHIASLAETIAGFHQQTDIADTESDYGEPEVVYKPVRDNFTLLQELVNEHKQLDTIEELRQWSQASYEHLKPVFVQRKEAGFIRECHGDLHTANIVVIDNTPIAFDCIEFAPELRWTDTASDIAFLIMDLQYRQQHTFAWHFLNHYLEISGDYKALQVLKFYLVYRAMVRAKVAAIGASQMPDKSAEYDSAIQSCYDYLKLAHTFVQPGSPMLIITCGMSASGKSTLTSPLVAGLSAIRLRSDVERKRLFKQSQESHSHKPFNAGIYSPEASRQTYQYLSDQADLILTSGYPVIIDAAFLHFEQRQLFYQLARKKSVPFVVLHFTARPDTLRQRISQRINDVSDADQSILEQQLLNWKPLQGNEQPYVINIDTESPFDPDALLAKINRVNKEHSAI